MSTTPTALAAVLDPPTDGFVQHVVCQTAEQFLDKLSIHGDLLKGTPRRDQLFFRGMRDARYTLLPSALREGVQFPGTKRLLLPPKTNRGLVTREFYALRTFYLLADEHGLHLPGDTRLLRDVFEFTKSTFMEEEVFTSKGVWPHPELLSIMALAQHHGVPTRLLDWSRDPFIAAYFACEQNALANADGAGRPTHLVVWVWNYDARMAQELEHQLGVAERSPVAIVTAPRAGNANLFAQRGVFTAVPSTVEWDAPADRASMEQALSKAATAGGSGGIPHFHKVTLPTTEARHLLTLLAKAGACAARVFPGFDGVVRSMREEDVHEDLSERNAKDVTPPSAVDLFTGAAK